MASMLNLHVKQKQSLQLSLKLWLPLLQAPLQEIETLFKKYSYENPFIECNSSFESSYSSSSSLGNSDNEKRNFIENMSLYKESLFDVISKQIEAPLFPTPNSQKVAMEIFANINTDGYFEGDIESIGKKLNTTKEFVENVRQRFSKLEPTGIGAIDIQEAFLFQLSNLAISDEVYTFTRKIIENLNTIDKYCKHHHFETARDIIKQFQYPPAAEYISDQPYIIPDFFVEVKDDIVIKINNNYYPDVVVKDPFTSKNSELKEKLKEARDLVNLLDLRKSTLYKLVLLIVEKQIAFFIGSELKPLTMAQIAEELGFEESTISRAVSNKYIQCDKGMFSLRSFFTNAVSEGLSSSEIKNYLKVLIENEEKEKPLTDQNIVDIVVKRYNMTMGRRTITKYRKLLNIPSSKERKRFYKINMKY